MKDLLKPIALLLILSFAPLLSKAQVTRLPQYRGWSDCYKISNAEAEVIIAPQSGGRVLYFAIDGENIIFEDPAFDGFLKADMQASRIWADGGRFDIGPEALPARMREDIFMGEWRVARVGRREVEIIFDEPNAMGLKVVRRFALSRRGAELEIEQRMTNIESEPLSRHYWGRVFCHGGGVVEIPLDSDDGWGSMGGYGSQGSKVVDGTLVTQLDDGVYKVGSSSLDGWISYRVRGLKMVQQFKCYHGADYSDTDGYTTIFYSNEQVCEIEPVSPTVELKPGESHTFKQRWVLTKE